MSTWSTHPNDSVDLVISFETIALEGITSIEKNDNLAEFLFDHVKHVNFVLGKFKIVFVADWIILVIASVIGLAVNTFSTTTSKDNDSGILIFIKGSL